jgi:transcription elongation factor Elf1
MENFFFNCPFCHNEIKAKTSWRGKTAECPFCKSSCVVPLEKTVDCSSSAVDEKYKVVIVEVGNTDKMSMELNKYAADGWQVVSQSTVFLSETSGGLMGLSGGTRQEGILYTLCKI